ncbi:hypothetical protein AN958_01381 [Leucoagaricus sp. SymC.cos]|nr:hypothetical protein AN958_01381 [Leucoagaricus sp. SymC.cos]
MLCISGFFKNAKRLWFWQPLMVDSAGNTVVGDNNVINIGESKFMKDLAKHTIPGVEHDSSERDPPPQCHPGTRLDICGQAQTWFHDPKRNAKILWIHGPAGVGKSAIMQTLAQEEHKSPTSILGATIFFSKLRQRNNPKKLFNTIAYQLATRYKLYRQYITDILMNDPKVVEKSMPEQFRQFVVVPFAEQHLFQGSHSPVLIILDGLDEVEGEEPQRTLASLIGHFALQYPGTPLIWTITSRPEPHITNAFSHPQIRSSYWTIEIVIDSNKACADVEKFLRDRFEEVRNRYTSMFRPSTTWPSEVDFLKVANASSGHFIFAEVVSRFIIDETYGNPISQLEVVIAAIEALPSAILRSNPLASIDNLYEQILSAVPSDIQPITMHLLALSFTAETRRFNEFWLICNWLELSQADAYGALWKLHSVLRIPPPEEVDENTFLPPFHKSFSDYILSPTRSGQYHIPDPLKSALVRAVRALYESHNPLDFTVRRSRIKVSWAYKDDVAKLQAKLFLWSLFAVTEHIDDAINCEDDAAHTNGRLAAFFRDIDYADFSNLGMERTASHLFQHKSSAGIFPVLEDWGLARPITISSIDLNHVRADAAADVDGYPAEQEPTAIRHFFTNAGENLWRKAPFSQYLNWQGRLREHLQAIAELDLPARVYLIGKGSKSVVAIYQNIDVDIWTWCYIIPYDQS